MFGIDSRKPCSIGHAPCRHLALSLPIPVHQTSPRHVHSALFMHGMSTFQQNEAAGAADTAQL